MHEPKITLLEQTSLPRIIVYLKHASKASRTELKTGIHASQQAIYKALFMLKAEGIIQELTPEGSPRRKDVVLTAKGHKIADALEDMEELF
jgi:DNA-binding MarR family transcriptional regulator